MKEALICIICLLLFQANGQKPSNSGKHIDTVLYLGYHCNDSINISSVHFLHIDLIHKCDDESNSYDKDSIMNAQSRLTNRLKLFNIDTLIIEYFSENINVFDILNKIENIKVVRLISGDTIELLSDNKIAESNLSKNFESLELYARSLKIDLSKLDYFGIKKLWVDVEQEDKLRHISFLSYSTAIENVYLSNYFPKRKKFCKKNQHKFKNKNVFSVGYSFDISPKNPGEWPSVK